MCISNFELWPAKYIARTGMHTGLTLGEARPYWVENAAAKAALGKIKNTSNIAQQYTKNFTSQRP